MNMQAPMMQGMMTSYIEQSKNMFVQMQEQMQTQAKSMFNTFPFPTPVTTATPATTSDSAGRHAREEVSRGWSGEWFEARLATALKAARVKVGRAAFERLWFTVNIGLQPRRPGRIRRLVADAAPVLAFSSVFCPAFERRR